MVGDIEYKDLVNAIKIEAIEKEEEFIFTIVNPWCEAKFQRKYQNGT